MDPLIDADIYWAEILRLDVTRFTTNYIVLHSLLQKKAALRQIFISAE